MWAETPGDHADRAAAVQALMPVLSGADPARRRRRALLTSEPTAQLDDKDRVRVQVERLRTLLR